MIDITKLDAFKNLSDEERNLALEILNQMATDGQSDILDSLKYSDFEEIPVDIDTFLDNKNYLGNDIWMRDEISGEERCTLFPYWRETLHKIFPDNLTTAYNTLILTGCLGYDTPIPLLNGKTEKIGDLAKIGKLDEYVYSYDTSTNSYAPGHLIKAFSTGIKPVYEITLDNGQKIKATSNHKFMTRDKHWKSIDTGLAVGDSMMPFNTKIGSIAGRDGYEIIENPNKDRISLQELTEQATAYDHKISKIEFIGNEEVFDLTVEKYHNFAIKNGIVAHNSIGLGKAQPLDSLVLTEDGFKKMGDLTLQDKVYGNDGKLHNIIGIFPQGKKKVCKVTFNDHTSTECCDEHLWTVYNVDKDKEETIELKEIISRGLYRKLKVKAHNYKIPVTTPIEFSAKEVYIDPYTLGVLIGDGALHNYGAKFASDDAEIPEFVRKTLHEGYEVRKLNDKFMYNICKLENDSKYYPELGVTKQTPNKYRAEINRLGLNTTALYKHIPEEYLYNSIDNRIALLQGLMDTDGFVSNDGANIEFTTISKQLCDDFVILVQSLGGVCHIRTKIPSYKNKQTGERVYCNRSYNIGVKLPKSICPFRLTRKIARLSEKALSPTRYIDKIEYIEDKECQCIYIDSEEHLYLTNDFIVTHNTECAAIAMLYLLYRMLCLKDPYSYYGLMPNDKITFSLLNITLETAKGVGWQKLQQHIQNSPWFMAHGALNASRTAPTWQPDKNIELVFGSSNNQVVGRALFCLDGDTEILTADGSHKIKDLIDKDIQVISVDDAGNKVLSDNCTVKPTIKTTEEYQIELADGTIIKCTPNHKLRLIDGTYKEVQDLTKDDELMETQISYFEYIDNIIKARGQWTEGIHEGYCERHHIIPRCLGGEPKKLSWEHHPNVIWLTAEEHYIAHKLLALENSENHKLVSAFKRMCYSKHYHYFISAEDYNLIKIDWAKAHSKALKGQKRDHYNIKNLKEYQAVHSAAVVGKNNPMYGKGYKLTGEKNGCYGHPVEPERLAKIKRTRTKYIYSYDNKDFYGWYDLQEYLRNIGYNSISQKGIESCIIGTPATKIKYPDLCLKITKRLKEDKTSED